MTEGTGAYTLDDSIRGLQTVLGIHLQTLRSRGCHERIVRVLEIKKSAAVERAIAMRILAGAHPILAVLPIVPLSWWGLHDQMSAVCHEGKAGYTHLNPTAIIDNVEAPEEPYYGFDFEDGSATLNQPPMFIEGVLKKQSRLAPVVSEVLALTRHTSVLLRHSVWAIGSRYRTSGIVPDVCLRDGRPELDWGYVVSLSPKLGSPSLGSR